MLNSPYLPLVFCRILPRYPTISPYVSTPPSLCPTLRKPRLPELSFTLSSFTSLVAANISCPALIIHLPDAHGLGALDPSCRHAYCAGKAGNHTLHTSSLTAPEFIATSLNHSHPLCQECFSPGFTTRKATLARPFGQPSALGRPYSSNSALSFPLKKQVCRLKGQEGPHRLASPDMFESNDSLRFDLEHPRQAAFVRVFVEDDLARTGTAFKFNIVDFWDSIAAKKYVANVKPNGLEQSTPADGSLTSKLS
ncbi:hypothetical protein FPCIR_10207 [Fusarium pseudocircinatum]|uniref:Uncharacterized protein n=1 Tax=Fusarium pseudocircinatum TaxID=56676 RepID=A0A8H5NY91_9HYPO|nr:hypothetical protein FPCIR_10207 [Fusarium pseudocircinatum]